MAFVITDACIDVKDQSCVEVCPVDCIHSTEQDRICYVHPTDCIDCVACEAHGGEVPRREDLDRRGVHREFGRLPEQEVVVLCGESGVVVVRHGSVHRLVGRLFRRLAELGVRRLEGFHEVVQIVHGLQSDLLHPSARLARSNKQPAATFAPLATLTHCERRHARNGCDNSP